MAEEYELKRAREIFGTLCESLDNAGLVYEKEDGDEFVVKLAFSDDGGLEFLVLVNVKPMHQVVELISYVPFDMPDERRIDAALVVCYINSKLINGSFDYDVFEGKTFFRLTYSYRESLIGQALFDYMIQVSCSTVQEYLSKFNKLSKKELSFEDFILEEEN